MLVHVRGAASGIATMTQADVRRDQLLAVHELDVGHCLAVAFEDHEGLARAPQVVVVDVMVYPVAAQRA